MARSLYIGNLPREATEEDLRGLFGPDAPNIASIKIMLDKRTGRSRGFAFVDFEDVEQAPEALSALAGSELGGRTLKLGLARREEDAPSPGHGGYDEVRNPRRKRGRGR